MTRDAAQEARANAVARHCEPVESFADYAFAELEAAPMHEPGICYLPECSARFTPARPWQRYCCHACERQGRRELARWGLRMAEAMLAWRQGKHIEKETPAKARARAARRYIGRLQSEWLADRERRRREADGV